MPKLARSAKELEVYQAAYALAMEIFRISSKLTDADGENSETDTWLDFAMHCGYLSPEDPGRLTNQCREVGAMLGALIKDPSGFPIKSPRHPTSDHRLFAAYCLLSLCGSVVLRLCGSAALWFCPRSVHGDSMPYWGMG